jgi:hypothetical protein
MSTLEERRQRKQRVSPDEVMSRGNCKHCLQEVLWAVNRESGAKTPLDPQPDPNFGNCLLDHGNMTFVILDAEMIQRAIDRRAEGQEAPLYANHLKTCSKLNAARSGSLWGREVGDAAA